MDISPTGNIFMAENLFYRVGEIPAALPFQAFTPEGSSRTDLANHPESIAECGFLLAPPRPADTDEQTAIWDAEAETWVMMDRPPFPPAPPPSAQQPMVLGRLEFTALAQSAGDMTDAMLVTAYKDPRFEAFWIKMQLASEVMRDHPVTVQALAGLEAAGYLPSGADAVLAAWPLA